LLGTFLYKSIDFNNTVVVHKVVVVEKHLNCDLISSSILTCSLSFSCAHMY